jgi:hypothetical protein
VCGWLLGYWQGQGHGRGEPVGGSSDPSGCVNGRVTPSGSSVEYIPVNDVGVTAAIAVYLSFCGLSVSLSHRTSGEARGQGQSSGLDILLGHGHVCSETAGSCAGVGSCVWDIGYSVTGVIRRGIDLSTVQQVNVIKYALYSFEHIKRYNSPVFCR